MNKFWKKYIDADYFERRELLRTLGLFPSIIKHRMDEDDQMFDYNLYSAVQSYIDDVIEYMDYAEAQRNGLGEDDNEYN